MNNKLVRNIKIFVVMFSILILKVQAQTVNDGLKLLDNEKYDAAKNFFQSMIEKDKSAAENYYYLGKTFLKTKLMVSTFLSCSLNIKTYLDFRSTNTSNAPFPCFPETMKSASQSQ